ncbi:GTP-binding protein Rho1 [Rhizophlyctis rosea]|nr:GTP-binding protein Rho1 [Rhizophlyctis rosea]
MGPDALEYLRGKESVMIVRICASRGKIAEKATDRIQWVREFPKALPYLEKNYTRRIRIEWTAWIDFPISCICEKKLIITSRIPPKLLSTSLLSTSVPQFRIQGTVTMTGEPAFRTQMAGADIYDVHKVYAFADFKGFAAKLPKEASSEVKVGVLLLVCLVGLRVGLGLRRRKKLADRRQVSRRRRQRLRHRAGIHIAHSEFEGRAKIGKTVMKDSDEDGNGHGTHVAGTIGSRSYGVAKKATLIAVQLTEGRRLLMGCKKAVANMSLAGPAFKALDRAVQGGIKAGVVFTDAGGKSGRDALKLFPAGMKEARPVAASDKNDRITSFSEKGECVDVIVPSVDITSTWKDRLRPIPYPDSHVILICFAFDTPDSLDNVQEKWISEALHFCAGLPIILVGCKKDFRHDPKTIVELRKTHQQPVTPEGGSCRRPEDQRLQVL